MECLLQAVSLYRKKDPGSPDEEVECSEMNECRGVVCVKCSVCVVCVSLFLHV